MRIYRRRKRSGEVVWWASWTEGGVTVRRSTKCSTKAAAELVVARWERERADPVYAAANEATFGREAGVFLQACEGAVARGRMTPETLSMYRQKAGTLVRLLGADLRLADINGATFGDYLVRRREDFQTRMDKPITESTLYKEWVAFHGILRGAWRAQRFGRDPKSLKPSHFSPEYTPKKTAWSWDDVHKMSKTLEPERWAPVAYVLATGARRREVFAAQPGDVVGDVVTLRGTKTASARRTIPIPEPMRFLLKGVKAPFARWINARRDLAVACKAAGVPVVTWNDLRRTYASLLVQAGVPPHVVARLLGHTTTAMVDRVYGQQTTESLADLVNRGLGIREPSVNQTRKTKQHSGRRRGQQKA